MEGPGTMTWEEFVAEAEKFLDMSDKISDNWKFQGDKKLPGQAYLVRQEKTFVSSDYPVNDNEDKNSEDWNEKPDLCVDLFEVPSNKERPLIIEHHILWSMSYSVPTIYFNGWLSDFPGINPISVNVAQRLMKNDKLDYSELSQAIHPLLCRPFLHLHPCGSRQLILNTKNSTNKLVSWLSSVAPAALNLRLRTEYFQLTVEQPTAGV